ncbi:MAG: DNA-3-methyladenine glycosylase I, partial [Balneolales bacterium]
FDGFDFNKIATYDESRIKQLLNNAGIIRNKLKVRSAVQNARAFIAVRKEYGTFNNYIWEFVGGKPLQNRYRALKDIPARTSLSDTVSKDLKRRGFSFVGSTIIYSHMQATGMVNDHVRDCFRHSEIRKLAKT